MGPLPVHVLKPCAAGNKLARLTAAGGRGGGGDGSDDFGVGGGVGGVARFAAAVPRLRVRRRGRGPRPRQRGGRRRRRDSKTPGRGPSILQNKARFPISQI